MVEAPRTNSITAAYLGANWSAHWVGLRYNIVIRGAITSSTYILNQIESSLSYDVKCSGREKRTLRMDALVARGFY